MIGNYFIGGTSVYSMTLNTINLIITLIKVRGVSVVVSDYGVSVLLVIRGFVVVLIFEV